MILGGSGIEVILADEKSLTLEWEKRLAATKWYFTLKGYPRGGRERRVPSSWLCLACQLQQDEHRLVVFGYLPPDKAERLVEDGKFHLIRPADLYDSGPFRRRLSSTDRPKLPTSILAGKDGQYWLAERRRWSDGLELTAADFAAFVETRRRPSRGVSETENQIPASAGATISLQVCIGWRIHSHVRFY